jgi:hypothetical protein
MTERDSGIDPTGALEEAHGAIETARRTLQELYEDFALTNESAQEIARNELCRALVDRLQLAEREVAELNELIGLARKSP